MAASQARQVRLVGATIAAISAPVTIAALFVHWYGQSAFCVDAPCFVLVRSGWNSLGAGKALVLAAGIAGVAPLAAEGLAPRWRPWLRGVTGLIALGAALVIVHRIGGRAPGAAVPILGFVRQLSSRVEAGPWIDLVACLGVAGGSLLAGIGPQFFEPASNAGAAAGLIWLACLVALVSLWLPWVGASPQLFGFAPQLGSDSAWHALHTLSVLLLLGVLATAGGGAIAAWFRWRAVFLALAAAGWLLAAFASVGSLRPGTEALQVIGPPVAHRYGYWTFLGCAALIVMAGVATAISSPRAAVSAPDGLEADGLAAEL